MYQTILQRRSIRSYDHKALSNKDRDVILDILDTYATKTGPFNHQASFFLVDNKHHNEKIGTYGFIKDPPAFIGGVIINTMHAMIDYGYIFEHIVLELTKRNFGTCWLGGTFKRKDFNVAIKENYIIPAVSPIGYPSKQSLREKLIRGVTKANNRYPISKLFFDVKDGKPVDETHKHIDHLKAVQLGPSASNKQPWRIYVSDHHFHLFLKRTKGYGKQLVVDIQAIDMGIAIAHLEISLKEHGYNPKFIKNHLEDRDGSSHIISIEI